MQSRSPARLMSLRHRMRGRVTGDAAPEPGGRFFEAVARLLGRRQLAQRFAVASNYTDVAHPSLPNYLALTSTARGASGTMAITLCPQRYRH